jgi:hypothetical protein
MFQMTVTGALKVHKNLLAISGSCINKQQFQQDLVDENGVTYQAHVPLGKTLNFDATNIVLGVYGTYCTNDLMGRELRTVVDGI